MKKKDESRWRKSNWQDSIPIHDENAKKIKLSLPELCISLIQSEYVVGLISQSN